MGMTIDEFEEYAKAHDYVIFTKQQYEHVIDAFNNYELLSLDYYGRLKVDIVAILDKIRAEITEYGSIWVQYQITGRKDKDIEQLVSGVLKQAKEQVLDIIDKYKADPVSQESEG